MSLAQAQDLTVEEIRKLALPIGTHILSGEGLLDTPVSWTTVIYPTDDITAKAVQRSELILVAPAPHPRNAHSDTALVQWASERRAAALLFCRWVGTTALAEAKARNLPLLALTENARIRELEKSIISLLVNRKGQLERRGTQIYRELTQISTRNEGMHKLIAAMARLSKKNVIVQDKRLQPISQSLRPDFIDTWDDIEAFLKKQDNLPVELHDRHRVVEVDPPVLMQALPIAGVARLVAPVVANNIGRGYLSIISRESDLDEVDQLVCEHGAAACALEMAKQKAVNETEKRLRGSFLDRLLLGDLSQQEVIRQGKRFRHDMTRMHVALALCWRGEKPPSLRRLETMVNAAVAENRAAALVWARESERHVVVFHATDRENPIDHSLGLTNVLSKALNARYPVNRVAIGLGQVAFDVNAWRFSYRDAAQAMELAERLHTDLPLYIGDLGVYQLILGLSDRDKLSDFCDATLAPIVEYDTRQNGDLIKTLEAFFNCHGNLSKTAKSLIVHRNTLLYRINQVNTIAGIDLNRPETRLALHLALTIRRLVTQA